MIKLKVSAANIAVEEKETLTEGRVGLLCRFSFTGEWDGLAKTAVFDGADSRDVILTEDTVAVPAECLAAEGYSLSVGVYGKNAAGDIVIPTVYATVGKIQRSAYPSGRETAPPTPDVVAQIQQAAANAEAMARAVREDAELGKFKGEPGEPGGWYTPEIRQPIKKSMVVNFIPSKEGMPEVAPKLMVLPEGEPGGWYTPEVTQPGENTLRVAFTPSKEGMPAVADTDITLPAGGGGGGSGEDGGYYAPAVDAAGNLSWTASKTDMPAVDGTNIKGPKGDTGATGAQGPAGATGLAGADGKSAYAYAVEGGYTGTEAEFAAKLAQEKYANPNALTFTGAVTGSYDGSAALSVEIPSGGGGTEREWTVLGDIDISTFGGGSIELTGLDNFTEFYVTWGNVMSESTTASGYSLSINGISIVSSAVPISKSGTTIYGWTYARYNGLIWEIQRSAGAVSQTNVTLNNVNGMFPYNHPFNVGAATKLLLNRPISEYVAVSGNIKIYGR